MRVTGEENTLIVEHLNVLFKSRSQLENYKWVEHLNVFSSKVNLNLRPSDRRGEHLKSRTQCFFKSRSQLENHKWVEHLNVFLKSVSTWEKQERRTPLCFVKWITDTMRISFLPCEKLMFHFGMGWLGGADRKETSSFQKLFF